MTCYSFSSVQYMVCKMIVMLCYPYTQYVIHCTNYSIFSGIALVWSQQTGRIFDVQSTGCARPLKHPTYPSILSFTYPSIYSLIHSTPSLLHQYARLRHFDNTKISLLRPTAHYFNSIICSFIHQFID